MTGNVITKRYMSDNEKFADVFNYILYHGKKVIKPEQLCGCDPNELLVEQGNKDSLIVTDKMRDIKKNWVLKRDEDYSYLLMGVENQTDIHYAMPLRVMLYDALEYDSQYKAIAKEHRKNKDLDEKEFVSGFSKEDKIVPVITVLIYYGADEWDGPRSLHDMLGDVDEKLLNSINDYKLNLIEPAAIEDMKADAREEGRQEGETIAIIKLYLKGLIDEDKSAEELGMSVEQYRECVKLYDKV